MTELKTEKQISDYIHDMVVLGYLDPHCKMCNEKFYPVVRAGKTIDTVFAPTHKPSQYCESGKHPHCSCDVCF